MANCSFCGNRMPALRGKMLVKTDGRILFFDSSKCERNFRLGREGMRTKWTRSYAKAHGKSERQ